MLNTTNDAVRAILKTDASIKPSDRSRILAAIRSHGADLSAEKTAPPPVTILRRREVAERLGRSVRFVDQLDRDRILRKVTLPGRKRAVGFRSKDVDSLLAAQT